MQNQHQPQTTPQSNGRDTASRISDGGQTSKKYFSCAETAKMVRASLREAFAGVKFSVRSSVYSGGASITVKWTDGPNDEQVESITSLFVGSYFDSMIDFQGSIYHMIDGEEVRFMADSVRTNRRNSDAAIERAIEDVARQFGDALRNSGTSAPTVAGFRNGDYISTPLGGEAGEDVSLQRAIRRALSQNSDRLQIGKSKTASKVMVIGDDGYSRKHGGGFSAVSVEE